MKRKLGQHFLKDKNALLKIAGALSLESGNTVIEIGAGHGELTKQLITNNLGQKTNNGEIKIILIEKDAGLAAGLKEKFAEDKNVEILEGDALKLLKPLTQNLQATNYKLVGNIPYYITGHLLRIIGELENKPEVCVFTIQKEVAQRISSEPPKMNRLAASVQFWAEPKIVDYLPAKLFSPPPEVDSATLKLKTKSEKRKIESEELKAKSEKLSSRGGPAFSGKIKEEDYYKMVRILFQQPRKTILNNLVSGFEADRLEITKILNKIGISQDLRPQNMTIEDIIELTNSLAEK